jgi:hypothetical protein
LVVGVGVGFCVGFTVGVGVGGGGVGVAMMEGGGVTKPESLGKTMGDGEPGVGSPWNVSIGATVGDGVALANCEKTGSDETGDPVATAMPGFEGGRARLTRIAPMTRPASASRSAATIGSRLVPDATARRLGYVTPAASPATGRRWWQRRQKVARVVLLAPQLGQIKEMVPRA